MIGHSKMRPRSALTAVWWLIMFASQAAEAQIEETRIESEFRVRQMSAIGAAPDNVAPPALSTLPLESIPEPEDERRFRLPISASLGFVGGDSLSVTTTNVGTSFPVYFSKSADGPGPDLLVSLGVNFGTTFLDNQTFLDTPDTLFSTGGSLTIMKQLNPKWRMMGNINASYQGDGKATEDVLNLSGIGMFQWEKSEHVQWTFGVAVTGQENLPVIPLAGVSWKPDNGWEVAIGLPQTRIAHRVDWFGPQHDTWLYTGLLGVGGGTYAVQHSNGRDDRLTNSGFPIAIGLEKRGDGARWFIESGIVVGRKLEYENTGEDIDVGEGFYSKIGFKF